MWFSYDINFRSEQLEYIITNIKNFFDETFEGVSFTDTIDTDFFKALNRTKLVKEYLKGFHEKYNNLLNEREKIVIKEAYRRNTNMELMCSSNTKPVSYSVLPKVIQEDLKNICDYLYDGLPKTKFFKESMSSLKTYYDEFYEHNFSEMNTLCPFCGLKPMKTPGDEVREPFDHYLLRSRYPFISLIRNNLVPMCHDCNEDYKGEKDISLQKAFYPFANEDIKIELNIDGMDIQIVGDEFSKEINSWDEIFDIKNRLRNYIRQNKASILSNFSEIEFFNDKGQLEEYLNHKLKSYNRFLYVGDNFIEKAILLDEFNFLLNKEEDSVEFFYSNAHELVVENYFRRSK